MPDLVETTRNVPLAALRFDAPVEFQEGDGDATRVPITLVARTSEPIDHWYWGRLVHDMDGMELRKPSLVIDYCHDADYDPNEIIGVATEFKTSKRAGLTISGELISTREDDRASDIIAKGRAGIPFEASIDFRGPRLVEEVGDGIEVMVNGRKFKGPGTVIRKWQLRSVAVCPYGADSGTASRFKDDDKQVAVTVLTEKPMAGTADDTKPEDVPTPELNDGDPGEETPVETQPVDRSPETPATLTAEQAQEIANKAVAAEQKRQSDIRALCRRAGAAELGDQFCNDPENQWTVDDVREKLFDRLCKANAAPSDPGNEPNDDDPDARFKAEYRDYKKHAGPDALSEEQFVAMRRVDEGEDVLIAGSAAA